MAKFTKTNQPEGRGRPTGSQNKQKAEFRKGGRKLLDNLLARALDGCDEAAKLVLPFIAKPKPYTEITTLDGQLIEAKITELTVLREKIEALEYELSK